MNQSGSTIVRLFNHSVFESETIPPGSLILSVDRSTSCDLRVVDFDGDGDLDLFLGQEKYFERLTPTKLVEHIENPLAMFDGNLVQLADIDGDGRLDAIQKEYARPFRFFRRGLDGRFIETSEKPLPNIQGREVIHYQKVKYTAMENVIANEAYYKRVLFVADWDSDGFPDLFYMEFGHVNPERGGLQWGRHRYYRHVVKRDLEYNSHFRSYEDIETSGLEARNIQLIDWNKDGWDDVLVQPNMYKGDIYLYEVNGKRAQKVSGVLDNVADVGLDESVRIGDWDLDGRWDLIVTSEDRLIFHQMVSGKFQADPDHPLGQMKLSIQGTNRQILLADWDQDGDQDLFVFADGYMETQGQYFEQQEDGSVQEVPLANTPFAPLFAEIAEMGGTFDVDFHSGIVHSLGWHLLDCDEDGDLDVVRPNGDYLQACERMEDGSLRCDDRFQCLGSNLRNWNPSRSQGFSRAEQVSLSKAGGRLQILASHKSHRHPLLWTAGFCKPNDPCNQKGSCGPRLVNCECNAGYEFQDCSGCEPQYYTASFNGRQLRSCEECPGEVGGQVCFGRGRCFDDVTAQNLTDSYTRALVTTGNGSCLCYEARSKQL